MVANIFMDLWIRHDYLSQNKGDHVGFMKTGDLLKVYPDAVAIPFVMVAFHLHKNDRKGKALPLHNDRR